jgi:hypothetical protein
MVSAQLDALVQDPIERMYSARSTGSEAALAAPVASENGGRHRYHRPMADPQGPYRTFLRERIAPSLRELGLRGSGNAFALPDDQFWALVGFQADWRSAREGTVRFTVNLTVADKAAWARAREQKLYYPQAPSANSSGGMPPAEVIRIGHLIPVSDLQWDRWWAIGRRTPPDRVAQEVVAAVRDHGIPWLRSRMTPERGPLLTW